MFPTIQYVKDRFDVFNRLMFNGRLPEVSFALTRSRSALGQCVSRIDRHADGRVEHSAFELRFSTCHDLDENVLEDVIIHEMIHLFILCHGLVDTSPHGDIFKSVMNSLNAGFGRHVRISHREENGKPAPAAASAKKRWHVIAAIHLRSGKTGIKVLPRVVPRILDFHNAASRAVDVLRVDLYLHDNPFFDRYPTSTALKYHLLDKSVLEKNLVGAHRLTPRGGRLIQE